MQRFESEAESEPNARNQSEPLHLPSLYVAGYGLLTLWIALTSNNLCGPYNWYEQDWDNRVR